MVKDFASKKLCGTFAPKSNIISTHNLKPNVMRKLSLFFFALFATMLANAQGVLPEFSTAENPVWYSVQFKTGNAYLSDGAGSKMTTVASASSPNEQFQFIGNQSSFKMKSKAGYWVYVTNSRFSSTQTESNAAELAIINGSAEGYFEIQRKSNSGSAMNQWGGTGVGKELGEWTTGDANNQLSFNEISVKWPEFSNESQEQYYFIRMRRGNRCLGTSTNGEDSYIRTYAADPVDTQLWKLVGSSDNFQLVNQAGQYIYVSDVPTQVTSGGENPTPLAAGNTQQEGGFSLQEAPNVTNGTGFELVANAKSGNNVANMWGGDYEGTTIGFWQTNDVNNVMYFVKPEDMTYADYKSAGISGYVPEHKLTLWYTLPATTAPLYSGGQGYSNWMEYSLPIGNGQFGGSLFGGIAKDEIQFNEKTLWSGKNTDNSAEYGDYENFGSVYAEDLSGLFNYSSTGGAANYYRQLDLTTATGKTSFSTADGSITFNREYIASNPAEAIIARYTASEAGKVSLRFTMESGKPGVVATTTYANGEGTFSGKLQTVSYNARFKVINNGGTLTTTDEGVEVRDADEVVLVLAGATDFDPYSSSYISNTAGLSTLVQSRVNDAANKSWNELYDEHVADFQKYFARVDFELDGTKNEIPTNELIDSYAKGTGADALMLEQLYFAYGRYLEIGSSRGVDLPSNLQGIWNNMSEPAWNADIHSNINVQMNYWPAEPTNLSEMHLPFLNYIWNMAENHNEWKGYASAAGQNRGWTCYTENNIFGGVGSFMHNYVIANAWYATHLWQHYRYTLDKSYLAKVFPAMLSASQFWMDRLILADDGTYETPNEYSPEHGPSENAVAHAQQLVYELFSNTLDAIEVLGNDANVSEADLADLQEKFNKLDKGLATEVYDGEWGTSQISSGTSILREWKYSTFKSGQNGHRHMSHLMCMYPYAQVTPGTELFQAAVNSMLLRGDGATGWSMGWKINLWARALDGDHARVILNNALTHSNGGAGVFYNLFDSHAPFQIDGNFGACAGMAEMIMQSVSDTIRILPALPSAWNSGHMTGLKAVKDFTVDVTWENGSATCITITNNQGQTIPVLYKNLKDANIYVIGNVQEPVTVDEKGVAVLSGEPGTIYVFDFDGSHKPTGIEAITPKQNTDVNIQGNRVSISGKDVQNVRVIDMQGRTVKSTSKTQFSLEQATGQALIVEVTTTNGQVSTHKIAMP